MEITTYGELKKALPTTGSTRVPGSKQLRESANLVLKKTQGQPLLKYMTTVSSFWEPVEDVQYLG